MLTTENNASVQQNRHSRRVSERDTKRGLTKAEAGVRETLGFAPTAAEVADLIEDATNAGLVPPARAPKAQDSQAALRRGDMPAELGYATLLSAVAGTVPARALDTLAQLYEADDVLELRLLAPSGPERASLNGRLGVPDERARLEGFIKAHHGQRNVYVGINPRVPDMAGTTKPGRAEHVAARPFAVLDLDGRDAPAEIDPDWSRTVERLSNLGAAMTVQSGNGWHVWFRIEPQTGDAVAASGALLAAAMAAVGADNMADPPRIIRVPGTINIPSAGKRERGNVLRRARVTSGPDKDAKTWAIPELCEALRAVATDLKLPGRAERTPAPDIDGGGEKSPNPAPSAALLQMALGLLPNEPGGPFDDRDAWQSIGHAIKGAASAAGIDGEGRELFLDWSARNGGDADAPGDFWDGCRNPRAGWGYIMRALERENPTGYAELQTAIARAAFEAAPIDPAQAQQLAGIAPVEQPGVPNWVAELNRCYAYVLALGRVVEIDPASGQVVQQIAPLDFKTYYDGQEQMPIGKTFKGKGTLWLNHPQARRYRDIGLWPVGGEPPDAWNLWRGFPSASAMPTVQPPIPVVDPLQTVLDFITDVLADGRAHVAEYILDWTAWKLQHPLEAPGTALAFVGSQGTGKTTYTRMVEDIFGSDRVVTASNERQMVGNFNAHFRSKVVAVFEEAFLGRDKSIAGQFKDLVTGHRLHIEGKFQDTVDVVNRLAVMLTSNSMSIAPLEPGDRRTTLIRVSNAKRQDTQYFESLWAAWTTGGRGAFIEFLLTRDLSKFDQRKVLDTPEKAEAVAENGSMVVRFWSHTLAAGTLPGVLAPVDPSKPPPDWTAGTVFVPTQTLHDAFVDFARRNGNPRHVENAAELIRELRELCPGMSDRTRKRLGGYASPTWGYTFPTLAECVDTFSAATGGGSSGLF